MASRCFGEAHVGGTATGGSVPVRMYTGGKSAGVRSVMSSTKRFEYLLRSAKPRSRWSEEILAEM